MGNSTSIGRHRGPVHTGLAVWVLVVCCIPIIVIFTLVALKTI